MIEKVITQAILKSRRIIKEKHNFKLTKSIIYL